MFNVLITAMTDIETTRNNNVGRCYYIDHVAGGSRRETIEMNADIADIRPHDPRLCTSRHLICAGRMD